MTIIKYWTLNRVYDDHNYFFIYFFIFNDAYDGNEDEDDVYDDVYDDYNDDEWMNEVLKKLPSVKFQLC